MWSAKTIANLLGVLTPILAAAAEDERIASNPAASVKPPRCERAPHEVRNADELDRVLAAAGEPWALIFDLLAWTGLRRGEALALTWGRSTSRPGGGTSGARADATARLRRSRTPATVRFR